MTKENEIKELLNLYILGVLDEAEAAEVRDYLKQYEHLKYYKETALILAETVHSIDDVEVPSKLKDEIFSSIFPSGGEAHEELQIQPGSGSRSYFPALPYAIAASVIAILFVYSLYLNVEINEQKALITKLTSESDESHHFADFVNNPDVFSIQLTSDKGAKALGKLAWNRVSNDAMLYVSNLNRLPKEKVYQIWVVHKDDSVVEAMGTFNVNKDGTYMITIGCMPDPSDTKAIFITMEPDGGMPHPTGNKYLSGYL